MIPAETANLIPVIRIPRPYRNRFRYRVSHREEPSTCQSQIQMLAHHTMNVRTCSFAPKECLGVGSYGIFVVALYSKPA